MGLFGGKKRGGGGDFVSTLARARALLNGDYMGAAQISSSMQRNSLAQDEAAREREDRFMQELNVRSSLEQMGLPQHAIDGLMTDPKRAAELVTERYKMRQGGAEGMTLYDGVSGKTTTTPGWHNGDYFGATSGAAAPERLYQGEKVFPVEKGGYLGVYGGPQASGLTSRPEGPGLARPSFGTPGFGDGIGQGSPAPGAVEDGFRFRGGNPADPNAWEPVGGASPVGSRTFRLGR